MKDEAKIAKITSVNNKNNIKDEHFIAFNEVCKTFCIPKKPFYGYFNCLNGAVLVLSYSGSRILPIPIP